MGGGRVGEEGRKPSTDETSEWPDGALTYSESSLWLTADVWLRGTEEERESEM